MANGASVSGIIDGGNTTSSTMSLAGYSAPVSVILSPLNKFNGVFIVGGAQIPYQNIGSIVGNGLGTIFLSAAQILEAKQGNFGPLSGILGDPLFWNGFIFNFTPALAIPSVSPIIQQPDISGNGIFESNAVWVYQDEMLLQNISDLTIDASYIYNSDLMKAKVDLFCDLNKSFGATYHAPAAPKSL